MHAPLLHRRLPLGLITTILACWSAAAATADEVSSEAPEAVADAITRCDGCAPPATSWIFRRSTFTHDPMTGARVAQYARVPPVEPLPDVRAVTSSYRRTRTNLRGAEGSTDTYYQVQQWGNDRGGIDAQWERFHDAWKESYLTNGYYNSSTAPWGFGPGYPVHGYGYGGPGYAYGGPGYGGPGYGGPGYGGPGYGNPGYGGPPQQPYPHGGPGNKTGHP